MQANGIKMDKKIRGTIKNNLLLYKISPKKINYYMQSKLPWAITQNARKRLGRLPEVVAYKNQTTWGLFREEVRAHLLHGR